MSLRLRKYCNQVREMRMKKREVIFVIIILMLAGGLFLVFEWTGQTNGEPDEQQVRVMVAGEEYGTYSLEEDREIEVQQSDGYNKIIIENGVVYMEDADCPDKYCVQQGKIRNQKQTIVCLPHRLVVEIIGKEMEETPDVITG